MSENTGCRGLDGFMKPLRFHGDMMAKGLFVTFSKSETGRFLAVSILSTFFFCAQLFAQPASAPPNESGANLTANLQLKLTPPTSSPSIWKNGVGSSFNPGMQEAGFTIGGGFATYELGGVSPHNTWLGEAYWGWMLGNQFLPDTDVRGNFEIVEELFAGAQVHPHDAFVLGETTLLRYNFDTSSRWMPFFGGGVGAAGTDIGRPDLSSTFEFDIQGQAGVHYFLTDCTAITMQYRFIHLSDAGLTRPNQGVNENTFSAGISWFF